jgi:hypothetical protein
MAAAEVCGGAARGRDEGLRRNGEERVGGRSACLGIRPSKERTGPAWGLTIVADTTKPSPLKKKEWSMVRPANCYFWQRWLGLLLSENKEEQETFIVWLVHRMLKLLQFC